MSKQSWTNREIELLKELYGTMSVAELIQYHFPNKKASSIKYQVEKLGLGDKQYWSEEEIKTLKILKRNLVPNHLIAEILNRSKGAVINKAYKLGFAVDSSKDFMDDEFVDTHTKFLNLDNRTVGTMNEYYVKIKLAHEGFDLFTPYMNNHKTDLLLLSGSRFAKVQIKSAVYDKPHKRFRANLRTKNGKGEFIDYQSEDVDFFVVKCNGIEEYYVIPYSAYHRTSSIYLYPHRKKLELAGKVDYEIFRNAFHLMKEQLK